MGRAKRKYELIKKERSRNTTFHKRNNSLKKMISEFSTLCDVEACLITFGPMKGTEPETWPEDREDVFKIIDRFKENCKATKERKTQHIGLHEFYEDQIKKLSKELAELQESNNKTKYPNWDDHIGSFSVDQLKTLAASLDSKIEFVEGMIDLNEGNYYVLDEVTRLMECSNPPLNQNLPPHCDDLHHQDHQHYNLDPSLVYQTTSLINDQDCMGIHYGTSSSIIPYDHPTAMVAPMPNLICYNPMLATIDEMTMANNAGGGLVHPCYFSSNMQAMIHPYFTPQLHQINEFHHSLDDQWP
ncbi:uncharacterized protein LOC122083157 [Macadamia integrifolia]|uniref:uncharacterized protein LOC122083157 n=1 Tax=Macadamia integrifolia TaxID=60698 RepID=UPI001C4E577E|nr:uncharacterized protein LOC122083157 [Macadamia integrifolia]